MGIEWYPLRFFIIIIIRIDTVINFVQRPLSVYALSAKQQSRLLREFDVDVIYVWF